MVDKKPKELTKPGKDKPKANKDWSTLPPMDESKSGKDKQEPDERLNWFFRVKIGGVSGTKQEKTVAEADAATQEQWEDITKLGQKLGGSFASVLAQTIDPEKKKLVESGKTIIADEKKKEPEKDHKEEVDAKDGEIKPKDKKAKPNKDWSQIANKTTDSPKDKKAKPNKDWSQIANKTTDSPGEPVGELLLDSNNGDILGYPWISFDSYQHNQAEFIISDPDGELFKRILKHQSIEIECGFNNGFKVNKFKGVIYDVGRKLPDGTIVLCVDNAAKMAAPTQTVQQTGVANANPQTADGETVVQTFEGEASFYGGGDGFDGGQTANGEIFDATKMTAAHKELAFGTRVRVTYITSGKSVVVTINDRGPYAGDRIIDLSKAAAEAIGMVSAGHGRVKCEVLGEKKEGAAPAPNSTPTPTPTPSPTPKPSSPTPTPTPTPSPAPNPTPSDPNALEVNVGFTSASDSLLKTMRQAGEKNPLVSTSSVLETATGFADLKIKQENPLSIPQAGEVQGQKSSLSVALVRAIMQGSTIVVKGNLIEEVAPGQGKDSGVILDYAENRAAFIGSPIIRKKTGVALQSGYGAITVKGWNVNDKGVVSATVNNPAPVTQHPTGQIQAPEWGTIKLADPIIPGCPYTWGLATREGSRVPESKEVMQGIVDVCTVLWDLTKKLGLSSVEVTSWYRDPATNIEQSSTGATGPHTTGSAVDFGCVGMVKLHDSMYDRENGWKGGLAIHPHAREDESRGFIHIDCIYSDPPYRRWNYNS